MFFLLTVLIASCINGTPNELYWVYLKPSSFSSPLGVFWLQNFSKQLNKSRHFATNAKLICRLKSHPSHPWNLGVASLAAGLFFGTEKSAICFPDGVFMKVRFSVVSFAPPGVSLGVIGSSETLGRWSLAKCVALSPRLAETRLLGICFLLVVWTIFLFSPLFGGDSQFD